MGGRTFQKTKQNHAQGLKRKTKQVLHTNGLILLLNWVILARNTPGVGKASPCPRIESHRRAPPTGTIGNYRHLVAAEKDGARQSSQVSCFCGALPGTTRVETITCRRWLQLNDARPRVHGQVVMIVVQVVKDALLHQRPVDGFLKNSFEVIPGLLWQVDFLIFDLTG